MPFSVSAGIGFIALFGVAVLNGIVLLSVFKQLREEEGLSIKESLLKGLSLRFRPVIMTASVASLGFLPMAISTSPGAEVQRPLATVVIGGLITATFLTLVVVPVVYQLVMSRIERKRSLKLGVVPILLVMFFSSSFTGNAQTKLSLNQCVTEALNNNQLLKTAQLELQSAEALVASGKELPKTGFDVQYGKTQTYYSTDYTAIVSQNIPWPGQLKAQIKALSSQKNMAEKRVKISQNLVKSAVKILYYQIMVQELNLNYLKKQEGIYAMMSKAATLKFKQGETNKLEQVAAEARLREFQQKELSLSTDIQNSYRSLAYWINRKESFQINGEEKLSLNLPENLGTIQASPSIQLLEEQVSHGKFLTEVEKQKLKPDLKFGLTNQSIENVGGQNFIQAGLNIPIFTKGQKAKVAAAEKQSLAYESQLTQNKSQLEMEISNLKDQNSKYQNSLKYFIATALPQADLLETTALKSYQQGEIEYVEMLQNTQSAWSIRENYLMEVQNNNQNIIQIETILGNE